MMGHQPKPGRAPRPPISLPSPSQLQAGRQAGREGGWSAGDCSCQEAVECRWQRRWQRSGREWSGQHGRARQPARCQCRAPFGLLAQVDAAGAAHVGGRLRPLLLLQGAGPEHHQPGTRTSGSQRRCGAGGNEPRAPARAWWGAGSSRRRQTRHHRATTKHHHGEERARTSAEARTTTCRTRSVPLRAAGLKACCALAEGLTDCIAVCGGELCAGRAGARSWRVDGRAVDVAKKLAMSWREL